MDAARSDSSVMAPGCALEGEESEGETMMRTSDRAAAAADAKRVRRWLRLQKLEAKRLTSNRQQF